MSAPLQTLRTSWEEEKQSAYLYRIMAEAEKGTSRETLFLNLSRMADQQAESWMAAIAKRGGDPTQLKYRPAMRVRFVARLVRRLGPRRLRGVLVALKVRGLSVYSAEPLSAVRGHETPKTMEDVGADIGERHRMKGATGNIRAAVFGINDGLVSNASLIFGVSAAASPDPHLILITGGAGLLAGALSMASGEYVSVRSQRELLEYQLGLEKAEMDEYPEEEAAELALIYEARGVPKDQAQSLAKHLTADPARALDALAREELGVDPNDLGSPWGAAISSFCAFAVGGVIPLIPFFITKQSWAFYASIGFTGVSLFGTGAVVSLFSGKHLLWSGLRMLLIGGGAGLITYLIGGLAA